jgi:translation initiation factor 3 subunit C
MLCTQIWKLLPNAEPVKEMLQRKIREEGLRTHLFAHSNMYKTLSASKLAETFRLPLSTVHSIVSKMMVNEELHASWDQPTGCIVMNCDEPTRLQLLALQLAEKAALIVENDKFDQLTGSYGFTADNQKTGNRDQREWQGRMKRFVRPHSFLFLFFHILYFLILIFHVCVCVNLFQ